MDGDNSSATRKATFAIGSTTVAATDAAGTSFGGSFTRSIGDTPGNYVLFSNLSAANFTLSATPGASTDTTPRAAINGIQIVAHAPVTPHNLYGRISSSNGTAIPNVRVTRSGSSTAVLTNNAGYYTFTNVPDGSYAVTPSLTGYTFTPTSKTITINGADSTNNNFIGSDTASPATYRLYGRIYSSNGTAIPNVRVTRSGSTAAVFTNSAGYYAFTGVPNGTYTVTPTLSGYTFTPATKTVTVNGADVVNQNFLGNTGPVAATYRIFGRIATSNGTAIPNVNVTRSGSATPAVTNSAGYFTFTGVPNGTYTVTPNRSGYTFTPASKSATVSNADATPQNFIGTGP
jgi:hypothetical protein